MPRDVSQRLTEADRFDFRRVHEQIRFGTASDRYAGWLGQVYPRDVWAGEVKPSKKKFRGRTFEDGKLPVASVEDYFLHFSVLEIDFTFYAPLRGEDGKPSGPLFTLQQYAEYAPTGARFLLKAPQAFSARTLRRGGKGGVSYEPNPDYLDAGGYTDRFLAPALDTLGDRLAGVLFEQEYARVQQSPPPETLVADLDAFFSAVPDAVQAHLEIRSPHLHTEPFFAWLEARGIGYVFSHWTWLPSIKEQWEKAGGLFTAANGEAVLRLLTPRKMKYEDAYALAHPFDRPVPALSETEQAREMIDESVALAYKAIEAGAVLNIVTNNRAFGNAPALSQTVANRFLEFAERHGA